MHPPPATLARAAPRRPPRRRSCLGRAVLALEAAWAAAVVTLPVVAWVAAGRSWAVTAAITFHPYLFAVPALGALAGLAGRRPLAHAPSLAAVAVFLALYGGQLLPAPSPPAGGERLRVMTYNVDRYERDDAAVAAAVREESPDVLALQEVADAAHRDRLLPLLAAGGLRCAHRPYYDGSRGVGMAVCLGPAATLRRVERRTYRPAGRWTYLFAELEHRGRPLPPLVTHLVTFRISSSDPLRDAGDVAARVREAGIWHRQESRALLALVRGLRDPTLVVGDFNSTAYDPVHVDFRRHLRDAFRVAGFGFGATYRYGLPLRIDYVYASPELSVLAARVGPKGPSDHRPVIADLALPAGAGEAAGGGSSGLSR